MDPLSLFFAALSGGGNPAMPQGPAMSSPAGGAMAASSYPTPTPAAGASGSGGGLDLASVLSGIKAPQSPKPQFSGGVSGVGMPFVQQMPSILTPALNGASERTALAGQFPSLGQLLAGGR